MPLEPVPLQKRFLYALIAAIVNGIFVAMTWSFAGFGLAGSMHGTRGETVGYTTIVLAPLGGVAAFLVSIIAGFPAFGARPWLRWAVIGGVFPFIGLFVFGVMMR